MPDPTPPPVPPKKKRATPGEISGETEAHIALADKCARAAAAEGILAALADRDWTDEKQAALRGAVEHSGNLILALKTLRSKKKTRTREETAARTELLIALDPILVGVKRTFPGDGDPNRALLGVGQDLAGEPTALLYQLAGETHRRLSVHGTKPAEFTLKGVKPAEILALSTLSTKYKNADFAQATALLDAGSVLDALNTHVTTVLNPLRRDLQLAADQEWPYRQRENRTKRHAFGIPADRPAGE